MNRVHLLAHLDALAAEGHAPTCWTLPIPDRALWTSELPSDQRMAARLCQGCPALAPCKAYGLTNPDEFGTYGALVNAERTPRTTTSNGDHHG